jgi:hypothetical protein
VLAAKKKRSEGGLLISDIIGVEFFSPSRRSRKLIIKIIFLTFLKLFFLHGSSG